jgi:hypothetical protein
MLRRSLLMLMGGIALAAVPLAAGEIQVDLVDPSQTGAPGDTLMYLATLADTSLTDTVYLNGIGSTAASPFLTIDTSPFFANAPLFMNPGDVSGPFELFDVTIDPAAPDGGYPGSFVILLGGPDGGAGTDFTDQADISFDVTVQSSAAEVPEPGSVCLVLTALLLARWIQRIR